MHNCAMLEKKANAGLRPETLSVQAEYSIGHSSFVALGCGDTSSSSRQIPLTSPGLKTSSASLFLSHCSGSCSYHPFTSTLLFHSHTCNQSIRRLPLARLSALLMGTSQAGYHASHSDSPPLSRWEGFKLVIEQLYMVEKKKVADVANILRTDYGFDAG